MNKILSKFTFKNLSSLQSYQSLCCVHCRTNNLHIQYNGSKDWSHDFFLGYVLLLLSVVLVVLYLKSVKLICFYIKYNIITKQSPTEVTPSNARKRIYSPRKWKCSLLKKLRYAINFLSMTDNDEHLPVLRILE